MRIAILSTIENYEWAGTEEVWAQFARAALAAGHQVMVSAHWRVARSDQMQQLGSLGLEISERIPFRPTRAYLAKERYWGDMRPVFNFRSDVLLINSGSLFDVLNLPALKQFCDRISVPKIFFCHFVAEGLIPHDRKALCDFSKTIHSWVFVSKHNLKLAERQIASHFNNPKVLVNVSKFNLETPLSWPTQQTIQMACVARLDTQYKGQDVLFDVLSQVNWQQRDWHLSLYGTGVDQDYLKALVQHYKLDRRVTFHGHISDIQSIWQTNHLMVLASRGEGTPLAVLEAMMCGRPTVTTDVGGNREILADGETGWIADVATPMSFSYKLEEAWENIENWPAMGTAAHQIALDLAAAQPSQQLLQHLQAIVRAERKI